MDLERRRLRVVRACHGPRHGRAGRTAPLPRARRLREHLRRDEEPVGMGVLRTDTLAAENQHARPVAEIAILDEDALVLRIVRICVGVGALAALDSDKVVACLEAGRPYWKS